ncbi:MAG: rhamnulokinase family protein [Pirellulaceae bacterium]
MANRVYLAVDLGASSGRVLAGEFDGSQLQLHEVHRFPNGPHPAEGRLYWDVLALWANIQDGLRMAAEEYGNTIVSIGVDTWGVDFALLDANDELIGNPYNYRDPANHGMIEEAAKSVSKPEIFAATGLQFMEINTLYQLVAMRKANSPKLQMAETFLMIPDYFNWLLTGKKTNEFTNATTTQFLNPATQDWATDLLQKLDIPTKMLQPISHPGTNLGPLRSEVAAATGLADVNVILPGTHDTASAVMAVPAEGDVSDSPDWAYISSGTWSLLGAEVASPVITDQCREYNFTNEGGVGGSIRLLKNITGLWLVQECRRIWSLEGKDYSWSELTRQAEAVMPLQSFIFPDDSRFVAPANMPNAIREYCQSTDQRVPESEGEVIRCALESLAMRCRMVLQWQQDLTGSQTKDLHIVGGGSQNAQLCQMTADACGIPVMAGPVEATAIGNLMMQAIAQGDVADVAAARQIVKASFPVQQFHPKNSAAWNVAYAQFQGLCR